MTQGLTGAGSALLQIGALLGHFIKKWFLGRTPRQAYAVTFLMPKVRYGLFSKTTRPNAPSGGLWIDPPAHLSARYDRIGV